MSVSRRIRITGIVQGVGFRPYVYNLAIRCNVNGWVLNNASGVEIEISGDDRNVAGFVEALPREIPPLAKIDSFIVTEIDAKEYSKFEIRESESNRGEFMPIAPDISICADCRRELFDKNDRRYLYPFINCTNCGPRFTIINDIPYDRPKTTMADFELCADCRREYEDPTNRRFHAQPVACPKCGPRTWLIKSDQPEHIHLGHDAIMQTRKLLSAQKIVAIKGIGGFHLACDALGDETVIELRKRKGRAEKPFALMVDGISMAEFFCHITPDERALLQSPAHPIVLLRQRSSSPISGHVAPGQHHLGVMLAYAPLHELILDQRTITTDLAPSALVMTSGNFSEEPIASNNEEAITRLTPLADAFLLHDRDIHIRCDDSVVRVETRDPKFIKPSLTQRSSTIYLRRSRGYAPYPARLNKKGASIFASGAELKNTFCMTRDDYAFVSHHIGDMENYETLQSFEQGVTHFENLFRITPQKIACDLHPNYLATRYALERAERESLPIVNVQHHHAHIAACMIENGLKGERPVIGLAFDGTGYSTDGSIWGGEILIADYTGFERYSHLETFPLPGGDAATKHPYRTALSLLKYAGIEWSDDLAPVIASSNEERKLIEKQIDQGINAPLTSSMGRLFDAVASLAGVRQSAHYEGQAAIELENTAQAGAIESYPIPSQFQDQIALKSLIWSIVSDIHNQTPAAIIAARFHNTIAEIALGVCREIRASRGITEIALSGGVWQNMTLLTRTKARLIENRFIVYDHHFVPPNDGGLSLGQAVIALNSI
jgi:hydrogenase maturation protein HypF